MIDLGRLYDLLEAKSGIHRRRDMRLERIAADRALEARYVVGTDGSMGIPHPVPQLIARTWPLQGAYKGVWENALWSYTNTMADDPVLEAAEGWWASAEHRANLERTAATTWGLGAHMEPPVPPQRNPRWYFINVFTEDLMRPAIVCNGEDFPDALGAGPFASQLGANVYLVTRTSLPKDTRDALVALQPSEIIIIGGTSVVSDAVATALRAIAQVRRVSGANRYATAVAISLAAA